MNALHHAANSAANGIARYDILDTPPEPAFDDLARRAADALGTNMAAISFFDRLESTVAAGLDDKPSSITREWFKARIGVPFAALLQEQSFYLPALSTAPKRPTVFVIADALADKRFCGHPLVVGPPHICFYAGSGIFSDRGELLGVLSVFDTVSRELVADQLEALKNLAELARARLEARHVARSERRAVTEATPANEDSVGSAEQRMALLTQEFVQLEQLLEDEIATRKVTEAKVRYEKDFSDAAIESLPGAFFMFAQDGRMVRWNARFAANTGYAPADVGSMRALDFIGERDRPLVADAIRRIFDNGEEVAIEAEMLRNGGVTFPSSFHGRALDIDGQRFCIGVGRDITERKHAEREISRAKERLDLALVGSGLAIWDWDLANNQSPLQKAVTPRQC